MAVTIRPKTICNMLYPEDRATAQLLEELIWWAKATKLVGQTGPLVVFSNHEWADLLGWSKRQVEYAMAKIVAMDIAKTYSTRHPLQPTKLRALHVEVSDLFIIMFDQCLEGGVAPVAQHSVLSIAQADGATNITTSVCYPSIYNKLNDKLISVTAEKDCGAEEPREGYMAKMDEIMATLAGRQAEGRYKVPKAAGFKNSAGPIDLWRGLHSEVYPGVFQGAFTQKHKAQFKHLTKELGEERLTKMLDKVLRNWEKFALTLIEQKGLKSVSQYPDFGIVYYYRQIAVQFMEGAFVAKTGQVHSGAADKEVEVKQPEMTEAEKKMAAILAAKGKK